MENTYLQVRYNVINITSLMTFANLKGGVNNQCKDVYFVRCIGINNSYLNDIKSIDRLLTEREANGQGKYERFLELPKLLLADDISFYTKVYEEWLKCEKKKVILRNFTLDGRLGSTCGAAITEICKQLERCCASISESILRNFIIKIFYWFDKTANAFMKNWCEKESYKFVISGIIKKQEYLYLYFLTMVGIDVMLLSPEKELELDGTLLGLSFRLQFAACAKTEIFGLDKRIYKKPAEKKLVENALPNSESSPAASCVKVNVRRPDRDNKKKTLNQAAVNAEKSSVLKTSEERNREAGISFDPPDSRKELDFEELAKLASQVVMITIQDAGGEIIGTGSGIMVGEGGYILTNNHVTSGGRNYLVRLEEEEKVYQTDELIKYNPLLDLAILRIPRKLKPIPIYRGNKELVRGQKVVAIGSPLGLFNSVSDGIISGFRHIDEVEMIQFTAPISHGSSGGAVLNMYGEVIGISTAGYDKGQNINLAVGYRDILDFARGFI